MEALEGDGHHPPGWRLDGLNPQAEDSIELWLAGMGEEYAEEERVNALAAMGVNNLYDTLFTRQQLVDEAGFTPYIVGRRKKALYRQGIHLFYLWYISIFEPVIFFWQQSFDQSLHLS